MFNSIKQYLSHRELEFHLISSERKLMLDKLFLHLTGVLLKENMPANLTYICTHNSRRSHFGQIAAAVAASYYKVKNIETFSGGTEVTAFNANAIQALQSIGFLIGRETNTENPIYKVQFSNHEWVKCFSKIYDDISNPHENFVAILTCSSADAGCPFIPGATIRISTPYDDPKKGDGQENVNEIYLDSFSEIVRETLYVFSKI